MRETQSIAEITPLSEKDCFYIVERHKKEFRNQYLKSRFVL